MRTWAFSFLASQTLQAPWTGYAAGGLEEGSRASLSGHVTLPAGGVQGEEKGSPLSLSAPRLLTHLL